MSAPDVTLIPSDVLMDEVRRRFAYGGVVAVRSEAGQVSAGLEVAYFDQWESKPGRTSELLGEWIRNQAGSSPTLHDDLDTAMKDPT